MNWMEWFDPIYDTMIGDLAPGYEIPGVGNAFASGSISMSAYEKMRDAYDRAVARLGSVECDDDLDEMVQQMEVIQKDLCYRMFLLGMKFAPK